MHLFSHVLSWFPRGIEQFSVNRTKLYPSPKSPLPPPSFSLPALFSNSFSVPVVRNMFLFPPALGSSSVFGFALTVSIPLALLQIVQIHSNLHASLHTVARFCFPFPFFFIERRQGNNPLARLMYCTCKYWWVRVSFWIRWSSFIPELS